MTDVVARIAAGVAELPREQWDACAGAGNPPIGSINHQRQGLPPGPFPHAARSFQRGQEIPTDEGIGRPSAGIPLVARQFGDARGDARDPLSHGASRR